jgi:hypothetical protein
MGLSEQMERKNYAAFTPAWTNYPPYISINSGADRNEVEVTIRSKAGQDGVCGCSSSIILSKEEVMKLISEFLVRSL